MGYTGASRQSPNGASCMGNTESKDSVGQLLHALDAGQDTKGGEVNERL